MHICIISAQCSPKMVFSDSKLLGTFLVSDKVPERKNARGAGFIWPHSLKELGFSCFFLCLWGKEGVRPRLCPSFQAITQFLCPKADSNF